MCGIAGVISKNEHPIETRSYVLAFEDSLKHRGPDSFGECVDNTYGFAHRRLAIVDIASGQQPMFSDDQKLGIVYNGEIYNYQELKMDLERKGYQFRTKSDTEVILKSYEAYGVNSFEKFNGMFAFCIWDNRSDVIYLARDYFGIKPLYIYEDPAKIMFSSELKAIAGISDADLSLDPAGFQDYLMFRYMQAPYTCFRRVRRLDAGTYLEIRQGRSAQYRYWDVSYEDPYPRPAEDEVKEVIAGKLRKAVESQLMGEVPIGVLLSGGIDSSAIAYFIRECGANLTTFNIGFPEVNEFEYSRAVASKYGLKHVEILVTAGEILKNMPDIVLALDEPIADPACFPLYILAKELKKHVTVVLSGEGGDEVFAGYTQYGHLIREKIPYADRFRAFMERSWYFPNYLDFLKDRHLPLHTMRHKKYFEEQPLLNGMLSFDMKTWMPENLMMKADKIMMAHSLEGRFPFLDKDLFEYVSRLPQDFKWHPDGTSKWLLREIVARHLPQSIIDRPKMGFTVPVDKFLQELKPLVMDISNSLPSSPLAEVLAVGRIRQLVNEFYRGARISALQVWTLFLMMYWFAHALPIYKSGKVNLPGRW
jgi:asparagine synthase (glutamine-hydrolysing)